MSKNVWFVFISSLAEVDHSPRSLEDLMAAFEKVKQDISTSVTEYKYHVAYYPSSSWDQSYGGFGHLRRLDENFLTTGEDFYLDLCANRKWIEQVHIIAIESGAYFANKILDFIDHHGAALQNGDFGSAWDYFLLNGNHMEIPMSPPEPNELSDLIRSVTLIAPSLPTPSGIMQMLGQWALPSVYDHQKHYHKQGRKCFVVGFLGADVINLNCVGDGCEQISSDQANLGDNLKGRVMNLVG